MTNKINDNWYENFFKGINCEVWENAISPEWTLKEVDFLIGELKVKPGQRLLDIPCGMGRHSIELSKRGYKLTGVDISETFIKTLTEKIKTDDLFIETIQADILTVKLNKRYSGAICMGNSFGYFNFDKMKSFVEKVSSSLEAGSRFIINSGMIAESILLNFSKNKSFTFGNLTMDITNIYNVEDSYMVSHLLYTKEGKTEKHAFKHYVFTLGEVKRLLKLFGFRTVAIYNSTDKGKYNLGDEEIYIVAEKV
jgi:cyclopropane fatty-acyl-phospholipid synthase-like methyltransferase